MTFEGEQNASMQNGLLVLQEAHAVNGSYETATTVTAPVR